MWRAGCGRSNVWIAEVESGAALPTLVSLRRVQELEGDGAPFEGFVRYLRETDFAVAAIDAPFSVPADYLPDGGHAQLLKLIGEAECSDGRPFPSAQEFVARVLNGRTLATKKPLRRTELHWQHLGVSVRSTLWAGPRPGAAMTAACLKLLYEVGRPLWPWTQGVRGLIAEAFPAAQLRCWNLPHQGYSRRREADAATRCAIVAAISDRIDLGGFRPMLEQFADALDAVICAFGAIGVANGKTLLHATEKIKSEGVIAVNTASSGV